MTNDAEPRNTGFFSNIFGGRKGVLAGLIGVVIGAGGMAFASAEGVVEPQRAQIEKIVRDYILENPEIIQEAVQRLQAREVAKSVEANRAGLETPYGSAWAGAENGDVVLVEFFDYACPYCHQSVKDVERLLAEDKKLKVVWRDWPVLGDTSVAAAEAGLTAAKQGKFQAFYKALFANGRPTAEAVAAARKTAGLTPDAVRVSNRPEIEKNYELARAIGASGTPVFVVGDQVLQGAVGYDRLKAAIAEARSKS